MAELHSFSFSAMGGPCALHLYAQTRSAAEQAAELAMDEVERIELCYSRYRPDSVLSGINRVAARGGDLTVDEETAGLLDYAFACHAHSGGLFDITAGVLREAWNFAAERVPTRAEIDALRPRVGLEKVRWRAPLLEFPVPGMEIDFGGIAKEYAADRAAAECAAASVRHGLVELGGDIHVIGPHPDGTPWAIGIRHPRATDGIIGHVRIARGGLAGSGDYARCIVKDGVRYSHLLDPTTGWPVRGLAGVNVHAERCIVAGSISTIAMLKGDAGIEWLRATNAAHLWIQDDGSWGGTLPLVTATGA